MSDKQFDVAIIGGGPGGATCGSLLRKYDPTIKVGIFERQKFPREHVGESQLPLISRVLQEMGVWDKVEAANFPIKIGATYRWGKSDDLWNFNFLENGVLHDQERPAQFSGQRTRTAFQVDRAVYDKILLDHAKELGCDVFDETPIARVNSSGDSVVSLELKDGSKVTADYYIDASGGSAILRRAMNVAVDEPSRLKNVAFWDYWQDAEWAVSIGVGGTRVQVLSLGYGWIWFIPIGPTRTSIGLVCPAEYYKSTGLKPEELYRKALADEPNISRLIQNATAENLFETTKDWSFVSERLTGENWMLVGESAGFADPVLAAGLTLTHASAREAAYTIIDLRKKSGDREWLFEQYEERNSRRIYQHIRFADYWYSANAHFSDLKEFTREIAKDAGLDLDAEAAFQWLGTGGFIDEDLFSGGIGTYSFNALHDVAKRLSGKGGTHAYGGFNSFKMDLRGARKIVVPQYLNGTILRVSGYERDGKVLPLEGMVGMLVKALQSNSEVSKVFAEVMRLSRAAGIDYGAHAHSAALETLEAMLRDGWCAGKAINGIPTLPAELPSANPYITEDAASL